MTQTKQAAQDKATVLIIDDEEFICKLLQECLVMEGIPSLTADCGEEGLRLFREHRPEIVVTDVCMPTMDGLAVLRAIRREDSEAKIVVMTGYGGEKMALDALRAGAANYINKPLAIEEFLFIIRAHQRMLKAQKRQKLPPEMIVSEKKLLCLDNDVNNVYPAAYNLTHSLQGMLSAQDLESVTLALTEAMINAIEHGNLEVGYEQKSEALKQNRYQQLLDEKMSNPKFASRTVTLEGKITPRKAWFQVTDQGSGYDWGDLPNPSDPENLMREHGRGLSIIMLFMSEVGFNERGNSVWMSRDLAPKTSTNGSRS